MEREDYMRAALALAHAAAADGEVPVGCVIADGAGRIIGRGHPAIYGGVLADDCADVLRAFFSGLRET